MLPAALGTTRVSGNIVRISSHVQGAALHVGGLPADLHVLHPSLIRPASLRWLQRRPVGSKLHRWGLGLGCYNVRVSADPVPSVAAGGGCSCSSLYLWAGPGGHPGRQAGQPDGADAGPPAVALRAGAAGGGLGQHAGQL